MEKYPWMAIGMNTQRGAVAVVVGILILVLVGFAALAIDIGYRHVTKNELQNAADTAALAAARQLGVIYQGLSPAAQQSYVCDSSTIIPIAQEVANLNHAAGETIFVDATDVTIGTWDGTTRTLTPTLNRPDAVRVVASRNDSNPRGKVDTFFARIFGIDEVEVSARATAALTGQGTVNPGELELPVGISEDWINGKTDPCGDIIKFSPTSDPEACGGWNTFDDYPANDTKVKQILNSMVESPLVNAGETEFQFTNGDLSANTFESLMTQYQNHGYDVDRVYTPTSGVPEPVVYIDAEGNLTDANGNPSDVPVPNAAKSPVPLIDPVTGEQLRYPPCSGASGCSGEPRYAHEWQTSVVVYEGSDCTPGQDMKINGFVEVVLFNVGMPSNKTIAARITCDIIEPQPTRGGGGNFGKLGNIPVLVE